MLAASAALTSGVAAEPSVSFGSTPGSSVTTEVVSRATADPAPAGGSDGGQMSSDGKRVLFATEARLVVADTNALSDLYMRDRITGLTRLVSKTTSGVAAGVLPYSTGSISPDGKWASYVTSSPDAAEAGALPTLGIYSEWRLIVVDLETDAATLGADCIEVVCIRIDPSASLVTAVSNGGRFVAYNAGGTAKLWDRVARKSEDVAIRADGTPVDDQTWVRDVSGDGRFVTFTSYAKGIVPDTSVGDSLYIRDRGNATTVSVPDLGYESGGSISEDGSSVIYSRYVGQISNVHVYRTATGRDELVSARPSGTQSPDISFAGGVSTSGRYVSFQSYDGRLVSGDSNNRPDVFVRDTLTGTTVRVSLTSKGRQINDYSFSGEVSADGTMATFRTEASDVVLGDQPNTFDVFLRRR